MPKGSFFTQSCFSVFCLFFSLESLEFLYVIDFTRFCLIAADSYEFSPNFG